MSVLAMVWSIWALTEDVQHTPEKGEGVELMVVVLLEDGLFLLSKLVVSLPSIEEEEVSGGGWHNSESMSMGSTFFSQK